MTSDADIADIYDSAQLLIDEHGDDAELHAAIQVDANRYEGDLDSRQDWLRIIEAIKELQTAPGESVQ
jgi:hypothetical protein